MIRPEWEVQGTTGRCAATGRELREGEEYYTVLFEDGESFRRVDFGLEGWQGPPEGSYCHFKTRVPVKEKRKRLLVDNEILVSLFLRLADDPEPARRQFRFVLALILMRKRLLRYEGSSTDSGQEVWRMTLSSDRTEHLVIDPKLTEGQIASVSEQLSAILHGQSGAFGETDPTPESVV